MMQSATRTMSSARVDGLRLLDLRDQRDARVLADLQDVLGAAHEAQRDEVDADRDRRLAGARGPPRAPTAARPPGPGCSGPGARRRRRRARPGSRTRRSPARAAMTRRRTDAVGEVDRLAGLDGVGQARPADGQAARVADAPSSLAAHEGRPGRRRAARPCRPSTGPMRIFGPGRSCRIATGRPARPAASRTSVGRLGVLLVRAVAEVQPRDVHARLDHPDEHLGIARGGADRGDDLRAALHRGVTLVHRHREPVPPDPRGRTLADRARCRAARRTRRAPAPATTSTPRTTRSPM